MNYNFLPDDFFDRPVQERKKFLEANADEIKEETYFKPLAHEERSELKDELSDVSVELSIQQKNYDEVKEHWRDEVIKPLKERRDQTVNKLKTGTEEVTGKVCYIRDHENNKVIKMAADGTELERRPMRPNERQTTTHSKVRNINQVNNQ